MRDSTSKLIIDVWVVQVVALDFPIPAATITLGHLTKTALERSLIPKIQLIIGHRFPKET